MVRHDGGPGERWVAAARPGDQIEGIGPRGKIFPAADAAWHLFIGDVSALPAYFAMAGALPAGAARPVILEVPGPGSEQDLATAADAEVTWLHPDGRPAGDPAALVAAAAAVTLPPGRGTPTWPARPRWCSGCGRRWPRAGWPPEQVSPKAYWGRGGANASHGEPAREAARRLGTQNGVAASQSSSTRRVPEHLDRRVARR